MRKSWFYKLLLSYLPAFIIVISCLIAVFFFTMGEMSRKAALAVNEGAAEHALGVVDHALQSIEETIIKEMMESEGIQNFFNPLFDDDRYKQIARPAKKISDIVARYSLLHSIYVVRWSDQFVISNNMAVPLESFADEAFIRSVMNGGEICCWSDKRMYAELVQHQEVPVVTLVKAHPLPAGNIGIVVINVTTKALGDIAGEVLKGQFFEAQLFDKQGETLITSAINDQHNSKLMTRVESHYTHWTMESVMKGQYSVYFANGFYYVLVVSGLLAIVGAIVYVVFISRRHYRPLEALTERLGEYNQYKADQLLKTKGKDEFAYIETVINTMIEQADELLVQQDEHMRVRKRQWIQDTLAGDFVTEQDPEWRYLADTYGLRTPIYRAVAIVIELDRYTDFCQTYSKRDQTLLKFLLGNVTQEVAELHQLTLFGDWLHMYRWSGFISLNEQQNSADVTAFSEAIIDWITENVNFAVTIAIGKQIEAAEQLDGSYESALQAVLYKTTLGTNRVIDYEDLPISISNIHWEMNAYIRNIVQQYKLADEQWQLSFQKFVEIVSNYAATKEELRHRMEHLLFQIGSEMMEMHVDYQAVWLDYTMPLVNEEMNQFESWQELSDKTMHILLLTSEKLQIIREERATSTVMQDVREYIAQHYSNPDLSLNLLSDTFSISAKYVSYMFKEEFGEKFVDYITGIRVEQAKQLLLHTSLPVQEIAVQVGYLRSFSFIRAFKKLVGVTPGDYRKQMKE